MKPGNSLLEQTGTTIFTVMSALANAHGAINLGQGFPDTDGPAEIIQAASSALTEGPNQYPPMAGLPGLRAAVAESNQRFYGLDIDPVDGVLVTSGATEAITACLMALINPGDEVVLFEPLYDTYLPVIRLLGGVPRLVRLLPPEWALPREELTAAFSPRTKLLLLNTPMNPSGKVFNSEELAFIAALLVQHDAYAVCDEVWEHLIFSPARHIPLMALPGMAPRSLKIGSAGKTFSLTGWKVGYVSGPPALVQLVAKAHQNLTFTTPPNLQRAVTFGLGLPDAYFAKLANDLQERRDLLSAGLRELGFTTIAPEGSYFLVADISAFTSGDDRQFCEAMTSQAGVAAIPVSAFYDRDAPCNFVRFAFCKRKPVLEEAIARLGQWLVRPKTLTAAN